MLSKHQPRCVRARRLGWVALLPDGTFAEVGDPVDRLCRHAIAATLHSLAAGGLGAGR